VYYFTQNDGTTRVEKPYSEDENDKIITFDKDRLYFDVNKVIEKIKDDYDLSAQEGEYEITFVMEYGGSDNAKGFLDNEFFTNIDGFNIYNKKIIKVGVDYPINFTNPIGFSGTLILQ